jgi:predicted metalloprotease with PDZ domain
MDRAMQPFQWQPRATVASVNPVNQQRTNSQQFGRPAPEQEPIRLGVQGRQLVNRGMMITNVARATIADEVGLEIGDVLVSVNGFRVQSYADIHAALTRGDGWATIRYIDRRTGRGTTRRVRIF